MPEPSVPPPLKVFQVGGSSYIPVFELELSGGTVTKQSPIRVRYMPTVTTGVAASRLINTTAPLAGGGDLSVDRTHTLDTAAMVTSGRSLSTLYPLSGGGNLSVDRTLSVDTAFLVTTARVINTTAPLAGGGDLSADRTFTINTLAVATSGRQFVVWATEATLPNSRLLTGGTGSSVTTDASNVYVNSTARTIRFPLGLMTVTPTSSNTFWQSNSGSIVDQGYVVYADSGIGRATYWTTVPFHIAGTPLLSFWVYHTPAAGNGTAVIFSLSARAVAQAGSIDTAYLNLVTLGTLFAQTAGILAIGSTTATNFDSSISLGGSGGNLLFVELTRHAQLAGDTMNANWNVYGVDMQCDVK